MKKDSQSRIEPIGRSLAGIVMLLVTALLVAICVTTGNESMWLFFLFTAVYWFPLPLIGLVIFLCNLRMKNTFQRVIVIWGIINILLCVLAIILEQRQSRTIDADSLIDHYCKYEKEIWEAAEYTRSAIDSGAWMRLEYDGRKVEMFHTITADGVYEHNWSTDGKIDAVEIGQRIGLTPDEIEGIRQRLHDAGCISIELTNYGSADSIKKNGEMHPVNDYDYIIVGRKRWSMSMYFYNLFRHPMSDSTWNYLLLDDCVSLPVCDTLALEYGSPAFGGVCYPRKEEFIKRLNLKKR
ncbi:MAG: hypothetical protein J6T88_04975 [Bacteroidales bacterium]|nr:hypothetical protein [Bacteroidales bacterium]